MPRSSTFPFSLVALALVVVVVLLLVDIVVDRGVYDGGHLYGPFDSLLSSFPKACLLRD